MGMAATCVYYAFFAAMGWGTGMVLVLVLPTAWPQVCAADPVGTGDGPVPARWLVVWAQWGCAVAGLGVAWLLPRAFRQPTGADEGALSETR